MNLDDFRIKGMAAVLLTASATAVSAAESENLRGWYDLGATVIQEAELESFFDQPLSANKVKFDPGFRAGIGLGTEVTRYLAFEVEGAFHYNSIRSVEGATSELADLYQFPVLGNIVLHFPNRTRLVPVIGAGVGAVFSILDVQNITLGAARFSNDEETWTFAYQGYAGLLYQFRPEMALGITYHYLNNDGPTWTDGDGNNVKFKRLVSHSLSLTFNFRF